MLTTNLASKFFTHILLACRSPWVINSRALTHVNSLPNMHHEDLEVHVWKAVMDLVCCVLMYHSTWNLILHPY